MNKQITELPSGYAVLTGTLIVGLFRRGVIRDLQAWCATRDVGLTICEGSGFVDRNYHVRANGTTERIKELAAMIEALA